MLPNLGACYESAYVSDDFLGLNTIKKLMFSVLYAFQLSNYAV